MFFGIKQNCEWLKQKIHVAEMDSPFTIIWNHILLLIFSLYLFSGLLTVSFIVNHNEFAYIIDYFSNKIPFHGVLLDIVFSLNTAYYSKGVFIKDRNKIISFYFKYNFWLDFSIFITFLLIKLEFTSYFIWIMSFLFTIIKINIILDKIEDYFQFKDKSQGIINLLKLLIIVLFMGHLCACSWGCIGNYEMKELTNSDNWLKYLEIENEDWYIKYINALYFSIVTMVTVGYGDISPRNTIEKSFGIVIIIFSCGFFAYVLNSVGIILKEMNRNDTEFK